jgi:diguanylate cyclase (GGDEF)-like protein
MARATAQVGRRSGTAAWPLVVFVGMYGLALLGAALATRTSVPMQAAAGPPMLIFGLAGSWYAVRVCRHPAVDRRTRRAWAFVAGAFVPMVLAPVLYGVFESTVFPSPGDYARIVFSLLLLAALLAFPRQSGGLDHRKLGLDVATVIASGVIIMWYLAVGPGFVQSGFSLDRAVGSLVHPLVDLVLLFGVAVVLMRGTDPSTRRPMVLLAAAGGCFIVGDTYVGYLIAHMRTPGPVPGWPVLFYLTAHLLIAVAAYEQFRRVGDARAVTGSERLTPIGTRLPYAAVAVGYSLLLVAAAAEPRVYPWGGLVVGAVTVTALVVARQVMAQRESHQLAVTDGLTGLANRSQLYEVLGQTVTRGARTGRRCAVVLADMNGFKQVNDTMGHQAGDQLLVAFATVLRRSALGSDLVARLGGDEFAVVLTDIDDIGNAEAVVRRIRAAMREPVLIDAVPVPLRASFGIAVCEPGQVTVEQALHRADVAMYHAKRTNSEGWVCYRAGMENGHAAEATEMELRSAVGAGQLRVWYQPIVALMDGRILGVEALVRWQHPDRGLLPPDEFLGPAERIGVLDEIDAWVLENACQQAQQWQRLTEPSPYLSVNIAAASTRSPHFARTVLDVLDRTGFSPRQLVLELADRTAVTGAAALHLQTLRDSGVRIALDDFGSDASSLADLADHPVDILKLDRSFVVALGGNDRRSAVAQALLRLGAALNVDAVAEGVENDAQARELLLLGCGTAQGYHFARPMTAAAMQAFIEASAGTGRPHAAAALG